MTTDIPPTPAYREAGFPSPSRDCVAITGKGQAGNFGSFRIAVILRTWVCVLIVRKGG